MDVDKFVAGLHVLVVDDDRVCLTLIAKQLRLCNYKVTTMLQPEMALDMLRVRRDQEDQFDIVITDVHMPGMDGFKLLELIGLEMDIPVIMLSANDTFETMVKGLQHGACDYLVKPVRIEDLKPLWKHVVRKDESNFTSNSNDKDDSQSEIGESNHTMKISRKTKRHEGIAREDNGNTSIPKRKRIQWSGELHRKFVRVVDHISIHRAVPKKILDMMNVEGLTRDHIASHLQKYRLYLKKISDGTFTNSSPFTESVWSQGNSINVNGEEHFEHIPENGIYHSPHPFLAFQAQATPLQG